MMTQDIFNETVKKFELLYKIIQKSKIVPPTIEELKEKLDRGEEVENPFIWMIEYNNFNTEIILYFDNINTDWTKQYHYDRDNFPDESTVLPEIYKDFKLYVTNLMEEKYIECKELKEKIFTSY